jgi:Chlorophyll A-B binding protein
MAAAAFACHAARSRTFAPLFTGREFKKLLTSGHTVTPLFSLKQVSQHNTSPPPANMRTTCAMALVVSLATASAFVQPASKSLGIGRAAGSKSALQMADASNLIGKPFGPTGGMFDPLGLSEKASQDDLKKWQEAEVKHGRVAMLAVAGSLVAENFHPLFVSASCHAMMYPRA